MEDITGIVKKLTDHGHEILAIASDAFDSPIGRVTVHACEHGVFSVGWDESDTPVTQRNDGNPLRPATQAAHEVAVAYATTAVEQLSAYFSGARSAFDLPMVYEGTPFQKAVWHALQSIPYGETRSYQDIAVQIERPLAVRAVGQANRANPLAVVIPCHRVIGKNGSLVGYAGSHTDLKSTLLELEQARG